MSDTARTTRTTLLCLAMIAVSSRAAAHRFEHPKILRLGVKDGEILLSVSLDVNPGADAIRTRALFDRNTDGRLDEEEQRKLAKYLEQLAWLWLEVRVDGDELRFEKVQVTPHRFDRPAESSDTIGASFLYRAALAIGDRRSMTLVVKDRDRDRRKHVPVTVDVGGEWVLGTNNVGRVQAGGRRLVGIELDGGRKLELTVTRTDSLLQGNRPAP